MKILTLLPTIRTQQFSDSFKGFTFIVEKKQNNNLQNIFLHDKGDNSKIYHPTSLKQMRLRLSLKKEF